MAVSNKLGANIEIESCVILIGAMILHTFYFRHHNMVIGVIPFLIFAANLIFVAAINAVVIDSSKELHRLSVFA